jgi:hypothetical protein
MLVLIYIYIYIVPVVTDNTGANPGEGLTSVENRRMLAVRAAVHAQLRPE